MSKGKKGLHKFAQAKRRFDESKVARDEDGRFATQSGGSSTKSMLEEYRKRRSERMGSQPDKVDPPPPAKPSDIDPPQPPVKPFKPPKEKKSKQAAPVKLEENEKPAAKPIPEKLPEPEQPLRQGSKTLFAQEWEPAWDNAPEDLKTVLGVIDQPTVALVDQKNLNTSYYQSTGKASDPDYIYMIDAYSPSNDTGRGRAVWRHEYGHYLDDHIPRFIGRQRLQPILKKKGVEGQWDLEDMADTDPERADQVIGEIRDELGMHSGHPGQTLHSFEKFAARPALGAHLESSRWLSDTVPAHEAFRADEKELVNRAAAVQKRYIQAYKTGYDAYAEKMHLPINLESKLKGQPDSPYVQAEVGMEILSHNITQKLKQVRFDHDVKRGLKSPDDLVFMKPNDDDGVYANHVAQELARTHPDSGMTKLIQSAPQLVIQNIFDATKFLMSPDDPELLVQTAERVFAAQGSNTDHLINDLIGSITKNQVGYGHSDAYYNRDTLHTANTEAFANLVSIYGSGHPLAEAILKDLAPNGFQHMKDTFQKVIEHARQ